MVFKYEIVTIKQSTWKCLDFQMLELNPTKSPLKSHEPPLKFHEIPIKSPIKSQENHHEITISESSASFFENPGDLAESSEALASEVTETTTRNTATSWRPFREGGRGLDGLADILRMVHVTMI